MPDRCSKFEESKHSAPIFCRISSAQRGGGVFVRSLEGSTFRNSELLFAKVCRFLFGKFGHLHARWRPFGVHVFDSSTSDLESVAEGCWRRFNSHCLIERWHHIVDE
jgi:hypothetical protein